MFVAGYDIPLVEILLALGIIIIIIFIEAILILSLLIYYKHKGKEKPSENAGLTVQGYKKSSALHDKPGQMPGKKGRT